MILVCAVCILFAALGADAFLIDDFHHTVKIKLPSKDAWKLTNGIIQPPTTLFASSSKTSRVQEVESISKTREWLIDRFGYSEESLKRKLRDSDFTTHDFLKLETRTIWLQEFLSLTDDEELKKLVKRFPKVLTLKPDTNLETKIQYLQTRLELNDSKVQSIILKFPPLLGLSIEDNLEPKLLYLEERLQFNKTQIGKIITRQPNILGLSVNGKLKQNLAWLQLQLGFTDAEVSKIVWKIPQLLCCSTSNKMEKNLNWLRKRLDLTDIEISKIILKHPQLLYYSIDNRMEPKLEWLQHRLLSENHAALAVIIAKFPTVLSCSIQRNLEPTLDFCIQAVGNEEAAKSILTKNPRIFSYSLENRLKPRLKEAKKAGLTIDGNCILRMAKYTTEQWKAGLKPKEKRRKLKL